MPSLSQSQLCQQLRCRRPGWHFDCDCTGAPLGQSSIPSPPARCPEACHERKSLLDRDHHALSRVAFGLTLAIACVAVVASGQPFEPLYSAASRIARQQTYVGMVTCSRCLAKHSAKIGATASDCARVYIRDGAKFTLVDGDQSYVLEGDPAALNRVAGERVRIVGACNGETIPSNPSAATYKHSVKQENWLRFAGNDGQHRLCRGRIPV